MEQDQLCSTGSSSSKFFLSDIAQSNTHLCLNTIKSITLIVPLSAWGPRVGRTDQAIWQLFKISEPGFLICNLKMLACMIISLPARKFCNYESKYCDPKKSTGYIKLGLYWTHKTHFKAILSKTTSTSKALYGLNRNWNNIKELKIQNKVLMSKSLMGNRIHRLKVSPHKVLIKCKGNNNNFMVEKSGR